MGSPKLVVGLMLIDNFRDFEDMLRLVNEKKIVPNLDSIRPFGQILQALDDMENSRQFGKIVISFRAPESKL